MRDDMRVGDGVFFYHSSCLVPIILGLADVVSLPHAEYTQFIIGDKHYDPRITREKHFWQCVDKGFVEGLESTKILQKGTQFSITPVTDEESEIILGVL